MPRRAARIAVGRRSKYGAQPTVVDGVRFHSKREAARYGELKLLEKAGEIAGLMLQPRYELLSPLPIQDPLRGKREVCIGCYVADFSYLVKRTATVVIEDVKGFDTPLSKWKRKHVAAQYGIEVQVIK